MRRVRVRGVMMRAALRPLLLVLALPLLMGGECEEPLVQDSNFELWCGSALCAWQLDAGTVAKVPTWNESDHGLALVDAGTRISQLLPYSSADVSCIHFDLLADIDELATVTLQLDFDDDGSVDTTQVLATGAWTPMEYHWVAPTYFQSVRLSIRKDGTGHAVLARIQASKATDCSGPPPVGALGRPTAATCESAAQCASGRCTGAGPVSACAVDGRVCTTATDCPTPDQNPCTALGVAGGRCD